MTTKIPTTDERIKAGLQTAGGHSTPAADDKSLQEKDADELVHDREIDIPSDSVAHDLDEIVHEHGSITTAKEAEDFITEEEDMDDLVHRSSTDTDEPDH